MVVAGVFLIDSQDYAAGGVLIVVGHGDDGPAEEIDNRAREELKKLLPLAASVQADPSKPKINRRLSTVTDDPLCAERTMAPRGAFWGALARL